MKRAPEIAFLPAALELQETPPAPAGRAIIWVVMIFFLSVIVWAVFGRTDIVAVADGRIIASGYSKVVQPLELGMVTAIHVTEGQRVGAGDILIELDPTSAAADVGRLMNEREIAGRELARCQALADWLADGGPPASAAGETDGDSLLLHQWREFEDRIGVLQRERDRQLAKRHSATQQVKKLEAVLVIVARRARDQEVLAKQKLLPEQQYLEAERDRIEIQHDLHSQRGQIAELDAAIEETRARISFAHSEFHRQTLERLDDAGRRKLNAGQELIKANTRLRAQTIRAPVAGTVQQLAVHSPGSVVTPSQELMMIVPQDEGLEVEAVVENKDIGFVEVGQRAEIKVHTFPFTKYGTIAGKVVGLSGDAVAHEQKGLVYKMRVWMERSTIDINGRAVRLGPGMAVTVESKTGTRRMIEFFLGPLLRYREESVRER